MSSDSNLKEDSKVVSASRSESCTPSPQTQARSYMLPQLEFPSLPHPSDNRRLPMNLSKLFPHNPDDFRWTGDFTFIHGADCQLGLIEKYILKLPNPRWEVDLRHLKCAVKMINEIQPKPKFFLIGGDMVDTPPYDDLIAMHMEQYKDLVEVLQGLDPDIKLVCVCGNHDVGDVPTEMTMDVYRNEFGPEYFSFWIGGVKFTVLNSQYFKCPEALEMASFQHGDFLSTIKDSKAKYSVVFQHIPLFMQQEDEIDVSFLNVNNSVRQEVIRTLKEAEVDYIFYGHTHRNEESSFGKTKQVITAAIGGTFDETKSGFRIVYVTESGITHEYIPLQLDTDFEEKDEKLSFDLNYNKLHLPSDK